MSWFEEFWGITESLKKQLESYFSLHIDSETHNLAEFSSSDGNCKGSFTAYTGREIERMVHSYLKSQPLNFSTMRVTTWLKSHINVPNLAFGFTIKQNFAFYIDYIARADLMTDVDYLTKYYEGANATFLKLKNEPSLTEVISKSPYLRALESPVCMSYSCSPNQENLEIIRSCSKEMLERWLKWVEEAETLPEHMQPSLAARDLFIRRSSAELDPGNKFAVQMFGAEMTDRLVRKLWGGADP